MSRILLLSLCAGVFLLAAFGVAAAKLGASSEGEAGLAEFVEWDLWNWAPALEFWLETTTLDLAGCTALEIGTGLGGLTLWLALKGVRVVCTDLRGAGAEARALHRKYGVEHLVTYEALDATGIPYEGRFDLVVFKSVLGDIGRGGDRRRQERALGEMHRALRPGGELWFAENLTGSALHRLARRFIRRGAEWRYVSLREVGEMLSPFGRHELRASGFLGVFGRGGPLRQLLGALDRALFNYLVPRSWMYVVSGTAKKLG